MKAPYQLPSYFSTHLIPLLVVDSKSLLIVEANRPAVKSFGYTEKFLKASTLDTLLSDLTIIRQLKALKAKSKKITNGNITRRNGESKQYDLILHPLNQHKKRYVLIECHEKQHEIINQNPLSVVSKDHFFKEAIQNSCIVSMTDSKGNITFVNEKFVAISGYSRYELLGKNHRIINSHYHNKEFWVDMWKTISQGKTWHAEVRNQAKDGSYYWVDTFIMPYVNEYGKITDFLSVRNDITQRKRREKEHNIMADQMDMMLSGITDGFFALDHDLRFTMVNSVFSSMAKMEPTEMIGKSIVDLFPFMQGNELLEAYQEVLITKQSKHLDHVNVLDPNQAFRIFIYPSPLGLFVNFHDISEVKKVEQTLIDTTELFKRLSENVPGVIYNFYLTDKEEAVFPFVSAGCESLLGISADTLVKDSHALFSMVHSADLVGLNASIKDAFYSDEPWTYEFRVITKDGLTKWIAGHSNPYVEKNGKNYWYGYLQDITRQKADQSILVESEIRNRLIIENSGDAILFTEPNGKILSANPAACKIFNMSEQEIMMLGREGLVAEDPVKVKAILQKREEQGFYVGELLMKRKGGEIFTAEISSSLFVDASGDLKGSIVLRDITDRKKADQVKTEILDRFDNIAKHLLGFIYQYRLRPDGTSHFPYTSEAVNYFYSADSATLVQDASSVFNVIHPDDLLHVQKTIEDSAKSLTLWYDEYRVILSNGDVIWVEGKASPEREADGSILWHGYISDVTHRKLVELKLTESQRRLRAFFDSKSDSTILLDHNANILDFNRVAAQNAKVVFNTEMFQGQNIADYILPSTKDVFYADFSLGLSGQVAEREFNLEVPGMESSWWLFRHYPILNENEQVIGVSFVSTDITDKKRLSAQVEKLALIASRTNNAVIFTDPKGLITWVNKGFEKITEYAFEEVIGKKPGSFLQGPETDQATIAKMRAYLKQEESFKVELLNYSKSGRKYWLDIEVQPLKSNEGVLLGYMAVESDITGLKKAMEDMQRSEQALQTFMDHAPMVTFIKDLEGRYTFYNKMYKDFMKDKDLHAGYTDYDIFDKEFSDWCRVRDKHIVDTGETLQFEHLVQGQTFLEYKFPLRDALNNIFAVGGISLNITEKLEAQKKIAEDEERLRSITNNLNDGIIYQYVVNEKGEIESFPYASSGVNDLFEISADMLAKDPMLGFNMVLPNDLEAMLQKGEISRRDLTPFEHEYRILTPSGKTKWIQTRSNPRRLPDGKTIWDGLAINITKRKKLELALQASEAKLHSIFQTMISGLVVVDVNGDITYANQTAADILSLESEEIEHRYFASKDWRQVDEAGNLYPEDKLPLAIALREKKQAISVEHGILAPGEKLKWLNVNAAPLFDYKGTLIGAVASFLDVTERKQSEQSLQNVYDELNAVLNASTDATFLLDPELKIRSFNQSAALGANRIYQREVHIGDSILDFTPPDLAEDLIRNFKMALSGESVTIEREVAFSPIIKYWNQIRYLPVRNKRGEIIGVSFNASDISARKNAEQELFQSKRYFESLVNSQSSFLIRTDLQGNYTFANQKFYEKFGLKAEEIIGVNALSTILTDDHGNCLEVVAKCLRNPGQVQTVSLRKPNPAGGYFWTDWEYVALQDEAGKPICIQCVGLDTTEQKLNEIELGKVYNRLLLATQSGNMGIWEFYVQSERIIWDSQEYKIFGVPEGRDIDFSFFNELVLEEDRVYFNKQVQDAITEKKNFDIVFRITRKSDASIRYVKGFGSPEYDAEGNPFRMIGVNYDVTEEEVKNQIIKDSEERYRSMTENIPGAIFQYILYPDGNDVVAYMSNGCYTIWEIDPEESMKSAKVLWDMVHPDDVQGLFSSVMESGRTLSHWHWQWRITTSSGKLKWLEARGTPKRQADGSTLWYTVIFDVTSHRLAQEELQESQSRLKAIFDNAINAIILADDHGNYLSGNEAALKLLEYSSEEFVHLNVAQVTVHESAQQDPFQEFLKEGRQAGTIDLKTKTGKILSTRYSAVSNILPGIHLSIMEDITARVLAEKELVKSNRLYLVTSQINQMVVHASTKKEVFMKVCDIAITYGNFRMAWIGLVNNELQEVEPLVWSGHENHYFDSIPAISILDVPAGWGPTGIAAREKRIAVNNNINNAADSAYNLWREEALKRNYRSSIAIPIVIGKEVIAVFTLYKDELDFFTDKEINLLQEVTENIAFAVQAIDAEFDRQQKAIALVESEHRYRTLIRDLTIGVLVQSLDTEIISSNQAGLDLLGLTEDQLIGMTSYDPRWKHVRENGAPFPFEELPVPVAIRTKKSIKGVVMGVNKPTKNERIWLLVDVIPRLDDSGEVMSVITTLNNITELKEAEYVMQESRERIRVISDNLPRVAIYQFEEFPSNKEESRYIYFSSGIEGITGLSVQELLDNPGLFEAHIHPDDQLENQRKTDEVNANLTVFDIEYRFKQMNGDWRWFRRRSRPSEMSDGRVLWNGVIIDVTDQKMVELQLIDALKEKDLLIKEIHHRVKNNLQLISSIIFIKMASMNPSESRDFLDNMRQRIRSVALIHERLLQTGSINQVNVQDYLMRLIRDLQVSMAQQDKQIDLTVDIQSAEINLDYAIHCGLIVNELVVNAYKHAFKNKLSGVIAIQFKRQGNSCTLQVADNGISLPADIKPGLHGSFGMELLEIFIKQLKAEVKIERMQGTKFEIDFKIEA